KQIVYNLLSNAVKFSPSGGRVVMAARTVPRATVGNVTGAWPTYTFPLGQSEHEQFLELSVTDEGIGISEPDMARLFQAFSQIDSSLARQFEGTGLGLAMVRQLAELHGGTVCVASSVGEGARFTVWLPVLAATDETHPDAADPPTHEHRGQTAMIVEDDDKAADLIRLLLESEGFDVVRASTGEEALALAPSQQLSLIALDIRLPGMDGWEFLAKIRLDPELADVPVVVAAGVVDSKLALAAGAAAILQKPISRAELQATLAKQGLHEDQMSTRTVLVVDDDPKAVEVIAAFLPQPAYAVIRAYGGNEAITLARRLRPDLILLDLMMPEVSGFAVVEALQRDETTACIPILFVTAKHITASDRLALKGESDKVIHSVEKAGFDRQAFLTEVRRALSTPVRQAS